MRCLAKIPKPQKNFASKRECQTGLKTDISLSDFKSTDHLIAGKSRKMTSALWTQGRLDGLKIVLGLGFCWQNVWQKKPGIQFRIAYSFSFGFRITHNLAATDTINRNIRSGYH